MSYARFGPKSDVYVYAHWRGHVECCGCLLGGEWDFHDADAIADHLREHVAVGHKVNPALLAPEFYPATDFQEDE